MRDFTLSRRSALAAVASAWVAPELASASASGEPQLKASLAPFARFLGTWRGTGEGEPGTSTMERSYVAELGGAFIAVRNRSTYAPQPKNPKGEVHEDAGFMSFDKARGRAVLRQFHVEGFVNQYVAATPAFVDDMLVFDSEAIENIAPGWRARETYRFTGADEFEETFELAAPGKAFEVYSRARLKRA